jgi:hypothetical protein
LHTSHLTRRVDRDDVLDLRQIPPPGSECPATNSGIDDTAGRTLITDSRPPAITSAQKRPIWATYAL